MKNLERSYEALQISSLLGEPLTDGEELRRRTLASQNPLSTHECAVLTELTQCLDTTLANHEETALDEALINRVLSRARLTLRPATLHLVKDEPDFKRPTRQNTRSGATRFMPWVLTAVTLLVAGGAWVLTRETRVQALTGTTPVQSAREMGSVSLARAELVFVSGQLQAGAKSAAVGGLPLTPGAVIETGAGQACFTIDPGVDVCLASRSLVELGSLDEHRLEVRVKRGLVLATLRHRAAGQTFSLVYDGVRATAKGTTFGVDARGQAAEVVVLEGAVEVASSNGGVPDVVRAHWRFSPPTTRSPSPSSHSAMGHAEEARLWAQLAPREFWRKSEVIGTLELLTTAHDLTAAIDDGQRFALPLVTLLPTGTRRLSVRNAAGEEDTYVLEVAAGEKRSLEVSEPAARKPIEPNVASTAAPAQASPSTKGLLDRARTALKLGQVSKALKAYKDLRQAFPSSPEARTVLPIIGRLELEQRKDPGSALSYFDTYLKQPGPLWQEALSGKIRALNALNRRADERLAIQQYLARYPSSLEASGLTQRLHTLGSH